MEKKSKKSIIIGLSVMFVVTLILLGVTYAYYRTRIVDNPNQQSISAQTKKLEITYRDGSAYFISGETGVESEIAGGVKEKIEPGDSFRKEFAVENTGDGDAKFSIKIDNIVTTYERMQDWTYTLTGGGLSEPVTGNLSNVSYLVNSISIGSKGLLNYTLVITYENSSEDQSVDMGASLKFRVNIADEYKVLFGNKPVNSLLHYIGKNNAYLAPEDSSSPIDVTGLSMTEDDNGPSYYFSGDVDNNYVNFSGMCWRIVRVQGNETIKLVLADENNECDSTLYSVDNTTSAFIGGKTDYTYTSNYYSADGLIYETSNIPSIISTWAERSEKPIDTSKLDTTAVWCNDTSYGKVEDISETVGYEFVLYYYRGSMNPFTLKCDNVGVNNSTTTKYIGGMGLLTMDEVAFAGAKDNAYQIAGNNATRRSDGLDKYYLTDNASGYKWATMTPLYFENPGSAILAVVRSDGSLNHYGLSYYQDDSNNFDFDKPAYLAVRPAVVLRSDVTITTESDTSLYGEPGTQTNPYVIS